MRYELNELGHSGTAIILGAKQDSGNIGAATATALAFDEGWKVIGDDCMVGDGSRPPGGNIPDDETARRHGYVVTDKGRYGRYEVPSFDFFKDKDADALVVTLGATYKGHYADIPMGEITRIMNANLIMPLEAVRRFVQANEAKDHDDYITFREGSAKKIILVGSYAHRHPFTNGTLYCAAKAGLNMAAQTLAWELTDRNYRVHIVHPYHVQGTPMWEQVEKDVMKSKAMSWEEADAYNRKDLKMPDLLEAWQVADVITALVRDSALDWITGPIELYGGSR